ncbi:hypothetical protein FQN60_013135 [Etheostoma spectabile]|uniref:Uncharacterized protein n=1 Tax=Etheostoma spectabile TaxID=54343 RepID=A0A5J5DAA3_9PERO|nr:hypothetical protein FQN60_013135 [Etheostoma spectabile]
MVLAYGSTAGLRDFVEVLQIVVIEHKSPGDKKPAKNVKNTEKSEVNYLAPLPAGESEDPLESVRQELISGT